MHGSICTLKSLMPLMKFTQIRYLHWSIAFGSAKQYLAFTYLLAHVLTPRNTQNRTCGLSLKRHLTGEKCTQEGNKANAFSCLSAGQLMDQYRFCTGKLIKLWSVPRRR